MIHLCAVIVLQVCWDPSDTDVQAGSCEYLHVLMNPLRITPNDWVDYPYGGVCSVGQHPTMTAASECCWGELALILISDRTWLSHLLQWMSRCMDSSMCISECGGLTSMPLRPTPPLSQAFCPWITSVLQGFLQGTAELLLPCFKPIPVNRLLWHVSYLLLNGNTSQCENK